MAYLLASGGITIAAVSDGYTISLTTASVSVPANHDGSHPDLSCANTLVKLSKGGIEQAFTIQVNPIGGAIKYTCKHLDSYTWEIAITAIPPTLTSGYLEILIQPDSEPDYRTSTRFGFSVVRGTAGIDWIEEWNGTYSQIGENYVVTPKLFAGHKSADGHITGIYLGKLQGFIGDTPSSVPTDTNEGVYGYRDNKVVFSIDNNGANIGGWDITPDAIQCKDGTLSIQSGGVISSQSNGTVHWSLNKNGSVSLANGKVTMDAAGNAVFEGRVTAVSGNIAGWEIAGDSLSKNGIAINSGKHFIAAANVGSAPLHGDQLDWVKAYGGAAMYFTSANDYGFVAYKGAIKTFSAGSVNHIAGWNFDDSAIWLGTKHDRIGQFVADNASMTIGTNGIRGWKWRLEKDGSGSLANGNISWDVNGHVSFASNVVLAWDNIGHAIGDKLTKIDANGIYTGTLSAGQVNALACTFDKGSIGGWLIGAASISKNHVVLENDGTIRNTVDNKNKWILSNDGSGSFANGNISWDVNGNVSLTPNVVLTWDNIGHAIGNKLTRIDANGVYTGTLSAEQINSGTISTVTIKQAQNSWCLNQDGSGALANGNISWDVHGNVSLTPNVVLTWSNIKQAIGDQLTKIDANGVYTGTLSANQINSGTISTVTIKQAQNRWYLNQDGSGVLANGNISWDVNGNVGLSTLTVKNSLLDNVKITGSIRQPWVKSGIYTDLGGPINQRYYFDNIAAGVSGGWEDGSINGMITWTLADSGRIIRIANWKFNGETFTGAVSVTAPSGKYFFEDGIQKNTLSVSREFVELMGYGDAHNFYGWIVLNRVDFMTESRYGSVKKVLFSGYVFNGNVVHQKTFDGSRLSCRRYGEGRYTVYLPYYIDYEKYTVHLTCAGGPGGRYASVEARQGYFFNVYTGDDATPNDAEFTYEVISMADWN